MSIAAQVGIWIGLAIMLVGAVINTRKHTPTQVTDSGDIISYNEFDNDCGADGDCGGDAGGDGGGD